MVYHYTTLQALEGIIKEDNIHLWATRFNKLNDPLEFIWAQQNVVPAMRSMAQKFRRTLDHDYRIFSYIISFCKMPDILTMWRLYGNNGLGVILGFDDKVIERTAQTWDDKLYENGTLSDPQAKRYPDYFMSVAYARKDNIQETIRNVWREYLGNQMNPDTNNEIFDICGFIKHENYAVEQEKRYIRPFYETFRMSRETVDTTTWEEDTRNVQFRYRGEDIIPYCDVLFPKNALVEITVGYQKNFEEIRTYATHLLREHDYDSRNIIIKRSSITI
jgi:hypothetical protein